MKAHLIQITVIALAIAGALVASSASARPRDPESFEYPQRRCAAGYEATCSPLPSDGDFGRYVSWSPREANDLLADARDAVTAAGDLRLRMDMQMTLTNIHGGSWTSASTLTGVYAAPNRLQGALTIANPWTTTRSRVVIADGRARVSHPQTGEWEEGLKAATSYYPVIFTGCLLRMSEADIDSLELLGMATLDGEPVYHLKGPGGARDELELEYWLGAADGLPRKAVLRTAERPGWSDEAHTIRITATLHIL